MTPEPPKQVRVLYKMETPYGAEVNSLFPLPQQPNLLVTKSDVQVEPSPKPAPLPAEPDPRLPAPQKSHAQGAPLAARLSEGDSDRLGPGTGPGALLAARE